MDTSASSSSSPIPHTLFNFALSLSSPSALYPDQLLALLLFLTKKWTLPPTTHEEATEESVTTTENLKHLVQLCRDVLLKHPLATHFIENTIVPDISLGLACDAKNAWTKTTTGLLLGYFDTARYQVQTMTTTMLPIAKVHEVTLNSKVLAVRTMQARSSALVKMFEEFVQAAATTSARKALKQIRLSISVSTAEMDRTLAKQKKEELRLTFTPMVIVATKEEGLEACGPSEWFYCQETVYRVSEFLAGTCEKATVKQAHRERWRVPDDVVYEEKEVDMGLMKVADGGGGGGGKEDNERSRMHVFEMIVNVRKAIQQANLEIVCGSSSRVSSAATKSMVKTTTKVSVLLHNMEVACQVEAVLLSSLTWMFECESSTGSSTTTTVVVVFCNWHERKEDIRESWPSIGVVYEVLLPELGGWGEHGTLVVVFRTRDVKHVLNYHQRFSLCGNNKK